MPEAIFEDIIKIYPKSSTIVKEIDEVFYDVCEEGSIEVTSFVPSSPTVFGAKIIENKILIELYGAFNLPEFVIVKLSGIRKGRRDRRFPVYTEEEANQNNQFWSSWKR
jgi:hypothetical protein